MRKFGPMEIEKTNKGILRGETIIIKMKDEIYRIEKDWKGKIKAVTFADGTPLNEIDAEHLIEIANF